MESVSSDEALQKEEKETDQLSEELAPKISRIASGASVAEARQQQFGGVGASAQKKLALSKLSRSIFGERFFTPCVRKPLGGSS